MVKNWVYVELTDRAHAGEIVKLCDDKCYEFVNGVWVESSIMFGYFGQIARILKCIEKYQKKKRLNG
ncbi:MAG: hypothetical protein E6007_05315 [Negativicoccus succinicivorans]|nr:hypothetical protein [Negativicoccus succinicivorans]